MYLSVNIVLFYLLSSVCLCDDSKVNATNSTFQATKEWKMVEEGQAIPAGLHVRVNLETGKKEAKLLEDDEHENKRKSLTPLKNGDEEKSISPEELKNIIKNIKADDPLIDGSEVKKNFRSYDELKKDFNSLKMQIKTDIEIIHGLIENFKKFEVDRKAKVKPDNLEEFIDGEIITILTDLEFLVHQYDNAQEFARLNGFTEVIHKSLNSSNEEVRSEALKLLGSATQSNPKVQISALESGSINIILRTLALDKDLTVRSRAMYAMSCLLRKFPAAQLKLIQDGGLTVFASIFDKEAHDSFKLQLKIITLMNDLMLERKEAKMSLLEEENKNNTNPKLQELKEKIRQYKNIDLDTKLYEQKWCSRITKWFLQQNHRQDDVDIKNDIKSAFSAGVPVRNQHDVVEKVVDAIFTLSDVCKEEFIKDNELLNLLYELKGIYLDLAAKEKTQRQSEDNNNYFAGIANVLKLVTDKFRPPRLKEEL